MTEGIGLGMGFKLDAKSHLDVRKSFKTVEEMKNFPETSIPEGFTTFNEATGLEYQFLSTNEVSETLGKWRVKEYGSGKQWYTIVNKPLIHIDDLSNGNYLLTGNVENSVEFSNEICFIFITGTFCYITGLAGYQCAFDKKDGVWTLRYSDTFIVSQDVIKLTEKKLDKSNILSNTKADATDNEVYSAKYINALKNLIDALSSIISDTSISTDTTYSSYKIDLDMSNMKDVLKHYTDTAIAGLNKLTKEIINDRALVVKDNVLYLYKAADDPSNDYMQMMLINGVAVELGCTQVDMSDYYNKQDSDNRFAAKLDLDTLTTSFNDLKTAHDTHVADGVAHLTQEERSKMLTTDDIATSIDDTSTNDKVVGAKAVADIVPFKFGIDENGNYGYYKAGADTVTPFKSSVELEDTGKIYGNNRRIKLMKMGNLRYFETINGDYIDSGLDNIVLDEEDRPLNNTTIAGIFTDNGRDWNSGRTVIGTNGKFTLTYPGFYFSFTGCHWIAKS